MIELRKVPGDKILELGCGESRHQITTVAVDVRPLPGVDFTVNFEEFPWPIQSNEFEGVISFFCLEHISFPNVPRFLAECYRITKPGGHVVFTVPNTRAQLAWIQSHHAGWDGKDLFTAASELLFGSQDYSANAHRSYFTDDILVDLFSKAGFTDVVVQPYNERSTDFLITASKGGKGPAVTDTEKKESIDQYRWQKMQQSVNPAEIVNMMGISKTTIESMSAPPKEMDYVKAATPQDLTFITTVPNTILNPGQVNLVGGIPVDSVPESPIVGVPREQLFAKDYFNGGGKFGGYAREGYRDFACHEVTARHILARKPESVLEVGSARGYILKRIQDAGIPASGIEISLHCYLTRCCEGIALHDICQTPWIMKGICPPSKPIMVDGKEDFEIGYDLCYSVATLEHIPEQFVPAIIKEMARVSKRGLHGIDFGTKDDGFDKTHCCLRPQSFWEDQFRIHAPGYPVEIVNKESLEQGEFPKEVLNGTGGIKLNCGSFTTAWYHGWTNIDHVDLTGFAQANGYRFQKHDLRNGIPHNTGEVNLITACHFLEHLTFDEGLKFLKECRRVLKPTGAIRIQVPDAELLMRAYEGSMRPKEWLADVPKLEDYDEINDGSAVASTAAGKLWALLHAGHNSCYDWPTLGRALTEAGFNAIHSEFRNHHDIPAIKQILAETLDTLPCLSLYGVGIPKTV